MQFIDLKSQYNSIEENINQAINKVLDHGKYIMGAEVKELEEKLANYVDAKYAIACANGTDALTLALMAIDLKPDDEVIMPAFTYYATAEAVGILRGKPVFIDVKEDSFNINVDLIEQHITNKTKAIIPVSLYGQCSDLDRINDLAKKHNLYVIEDAAQSFGAEYKGKRSANLSHIATTSFFP
jgi:UDP-2-acetamido-2-deoxy-ribo-hexuluronate aminotransferase